MTYSYGAVESLELHMEYVASLYGLPSLMSGGGNGLCLGLWFRCAAGLDPLGFPSSWCWQVLGVFPASVLLDGLEMAICSCIVWEQCAH